MGQRDFNREMGSYLRERKTVGEGFFSKVKKKLPKARTTQEEETPRPDTVPKEYVDMVMRGERVPTPEPEEDESFVEKKSKRPFWHRWFFIVEERMEEPEEDVDFSALTEKKSTPHVDDDVKEMLRTCVAWVNMLPPEKIQEIKRSDDFVKFKALLNQYGLIKR